MTPAPAPTPPAASAAAVSAPGADRRPGLRERKKARTRLAIREATYALVRERGYDATTVEQIAERAEVSPSTVLRYFPTKEDIVLTDGYGPLVEQLLERRPADEPVAESMRWALRRATALTLGRPDLDREETAFRVRLMTEVPAVRARLTESMSATGRLMCRALAGRTGQGVGDLEVRVYARGLVGALLEALAYWVERDCRDDLTRLTDRALDVFRAPPAGPPRPPRTTADHRPERRRP